MNRNISVAFLCLWLISCGGGGSGTTTSAPPRRPVYFKLTFENQAVANMIAPPNKKDISAIGLSGDRSLIYFSTKTNYGVNVYDVASGTPAMNLLLDARGGASGLGAPGMRNQNTKSLTKIISGPANSKSAMGLSDDGFIVELNGDTVFGVWANLDTDLDNDSSHKIGIAAVLQDKWVAFVEALHSPDTFGTHRTFNLAPPSKATRGPMGAGTGGVLDYHITSAVGHGQDLYIAALTQTTLNGLIVKHSTNLTQTIDFTKPFLDNTFVEAKAASSGSDPDSIISHLAVVGDYLLVVRVDIANPDITGIGFVQLSNLANQTKPSANITMGEVTSISVDDQSQSAMIVTKKGLVFFYDGKFVNIGNSIGGTSSTSYTRLTVDQAGPNQPVAFAPGAPIPSTLDLTKVTGAVYTHGYWYVATSDEGVFRIKMEPVFKP